MLSKWLPAIIAAVLSAYAAAVAAQYPTPIDSALPLIAVVVTIVAAITHPSIQLAVPLLIGGEIVIADERLRLLWFGLVIGTAGAVALLALWWRSAMVSLSTEALIARCTAAIAIAIACSKVFSPQYLVWLVPFVALTLRRAALLTLAVAVVLTRLWFPEHWHHFNNIGLMFGLALPRNLAVCLLAILLIFARGPSARQLPEGNV